MRHLLHFGIFVLALAAVTQADAQDRRHGDRHTTVVIDAEGSSRVARPVRASVAPTRVIYDSRRTIHPPSRPIYDGRRAYFDQRQDLEQIVGIAERWERATASHNRHAQENVDRRLDAWLEREIRESSRERYNSGYAQRVRLLSDELARLEYRKHSGHGYQGRGHHGRGHGRGHYGRDPRGYYEKKARILEELVSLSERQVQRARANVRYPLRLSLAHR
jgi:hypothetical protein